MRYIKIEVGNGYCGCDNTYYEEFLDETPDNQIDDVASLLAYENAEQYEHCATGWGEDFEDEEEREEYYSNADYSWVEISEQEYKEGECY